MNLLCNNLNCCRKAASTPRKAGGGTPRKTSAAKAKGKAVPKLPRTDVIRAMQAEQAAAKANKAQAPK